VRSEEPLSDEVPGPDPKLPSPWPRRFAVGCGVVALVGVLTPIGGWLAWSRWSTQRQALADAAQQQHAEEMFGPARATLAQPKEHPYDIDETIRVIHGLDLALKNQDNLDDWLQTVARQDYRHVAPEVVEARGKILDVLQPLYAKQTELEDQQAMWEITSEMLLATLSVVSVSGEASMTNPSGSLSVDRKQAQKLWEQLKEEQSSRRDLQRDVSELDKELFDALVDYADVYYEYVEEWDRLSGLRDRAYLASVAGDWVAAEQSARLAIAQAPREREAHLLAAMAIIEQGQVERYGEARALLTESMETHPDQTAPALLLLGVLSAREGDVEAAHLNLQQAAAYYPKQADELLDMLDPYKMRVFLEKSREGGFITELYRSTMLGAGYFSPDLQLARLHFEEGKFDDGAKKVLDHFARRRAQAQWDFVISDIQFCQDLLGDDFHKIFPEDHWLDLEVTRPMMGGGLNLGIANRSDRALHNATLVLALHLTDQFPGQYTAVPAPGTVPAVTPHDSTSFGTLDPVLPEVAGKPKTIDDIVEHRAILITDEAVVWVDTDAFKLSEADEFRKQRNAARAGLRPAPDEPATSGLRATVDQVLSQLGEKADLSIDAGYGADDVRIVLPRELSAFHPVFRLKYGDQVVTAEENQLDADHIVLRFAGVHNFDAEGPRQDLELIVQTPFGDVRLDWTPDGQSFRFLGMRRE
jgi:tetratricopeptide (TPR) repeat protein